MDEMLERAAAMVAAADTVIMAEYREGFFPRQLEVVGYRADNLNTVWMKVRAEGASAVKLRRGVRAGLCMRRGDDSIILTGRVVVARASMANERPVVSGRSYCTLRFIPERASVWIDRRAAHYDLRSHE